jgi:hypothetical protein
MNAPSHPLLAGAGGLGQFDLWLRGGFFPFQVPGTLPWAAKGEGGSAAARRG